jgi:transcriptional regulator with XRE-family HTH domain
LTLVKKIHEGQNIKRFREMLGIKQEILAQELGEDWTQSKVSHLEARETIDPIILEQVAKILKMPVEAIKSFDQEAAISIVANTFSAEAMAYVENYKCTFNPLDKVVELYERLLKEKDVEIEALKKQVADRKK